MGKQKTKQVAVEMQEIKLETMKMKIVGTSGIIVHKFSMKAQGEMLSKQVGVTWPKAPKDPDAQYDMATYWINGDGEQLDGEADLALVYRKKVKEFLAQCTKRLKRLRALKKPLFGFPSTGLKACAIRGAKSLGLVMADMKGAMFIPREFIEIVGKRKMRSDMVRISHNTTDVRFRPEFFPWEMTFDVVYNTGTVTADKVVNMFNAGGFGCGIGEWRPEKGGSHGMFEVARS